MIPFSPAISTKGARRAGRADGMRMECAWKNEWKFHKSDVNVLWNWQSEKESC